MDFYWLRGFSIDETEALVRSVCELTAVEDGQSRPRHASKKRRKGGDAPKEDRDFEEALAAARRASLLDQQTKDNENRLDDTFTLVRGDSGFANAVTDLKEDCVVCLENLYKAEPSQAWCGALRVPCTGCDGKGPFVHAKCAERMDGKCPVCRGEVKTMFA